MKVANSQKANKHTPKPENNKTISLLWEEAIKIKIFTLHSFLTCVKASNLQK